MLKNYTTQESKKNEFPRWFKDSLLLFKRVGLNQVVLLAFIFLINAFSSMLLFDGNYPWYWILWQGLVLFASYPMIFFMGENGADGKKIGFEDSWRVLKKFHKTKSIKTLLIMFIVYGLIMGIDSLFSVDLASDKVENSFLKSCMNNFSFLYQKNIFFTFYLFFLLIMGLQTFSFVFFLLLLQDPSKKVNPIDFVYLIIEVAHKNVSFLIFTFLINPLSIFVGSFLFLGFTFFNFYLFMFSSIVWFVWFINFNLIVYRDVFENKKGLNPLEQDVRQKEKNIVPNC